MESSNLIKIIYDISATEDPNVNIYTLLYDRVCSSYFGAIVTVLNESVKWKFI